MPAESGVGGVLTPSLLRAVAAGDLGVVERQLGARVGAGWEEGPRGSVSSSSVGEQIDEIDGLELVFERRLPLAT
jgi:hypothetical protein